MHAGQVPEPAARGRQSGQPGSRFWGMPEHNPPRRAETHPHIPVSSPDWHPNLHQLNPRPQQNYQIQ